MKKFFKDFFSVSNEINENVVIGVVFVVALLVATFLPDLVDSNNYYILAGLVAASFGFGVLKK